MFSPRDLAKCTSPRNAHPRRASPVPPPAARVLLPNQGCSPERSWAGRPRSVGSSRPSGPRGVRHASCGAGRGPNLDVFNRGESWGAGPVDCFFFLHRLGHSDCGRLAAPSRFFFVLQARSPRHVFPVPVEHEQKTSERAEESKPRRGLFVVAVPEASCRGSSRKNPYKGIIFSPVGLSARGEEAESGQSLPGGVSRDPTKKAQRRPPTPALREKSDWSP